MLLRFRRQINIFTNYSSIFNEKDNELVAKKCTKRNYSLHLEKANNEIEILWHIKDKTPDVLIVDVKEIKENYLEDKKSGLGIKLIEMLASQLRAVYNIDNSNGTSLNSKKLNQKLILQLYKKN